MNIKFYKKSKNLKKMRIKLAKTVEYGHGYSILRSSSTLIDNEFIYELSHKYDNYGFMPQQLGEELEELFESKDYLIGIHRTGYTLINDKILKDIFEKGLICNGHAMLGANVGKNDIETTISLFGDFPILVGQLKLAYEYKLSKGSIIVKIPKSYLGKADGEIKPIYYIDDNILKLLPEFIYGYVPVNDKGELDNIIHNEKYSNTHSYDNEGLIYEQGAISKAKKEGIDLENNIKNM